jgi:peptidoglycan/LPS O-acetylase OafA/YrhL
MIESNSVFDGRSRFYALDGLRGIAALLVVLLHVEWPNHITSNNFVKNGYLAVDLFFILSGLVISANYSTRIVDFKDAWNFIRLRFFRLYPRAFEIVPEHEPFTGGESYWTLAANVFLVQGLGTVDKLNWNGPSWSISCEFFAYVLFVVAMLTGVTRGRAFFIGGCIIAAAAYAAIALDRGTLDVVFDLGFVRCIAGFFLGMLIFKFANAMQFRSLSHIKGLEITASLMVIGAMYALSGPMIALVIPLFVAAIFLLQFAGRSRAYSCQGRHNSSVAYRIQSTWSIRLL